MAASYPAVIHTFTSVSNQVDIVDAADVNDLQLEVAAIETELGVDVAGSLTDLVARLTVLLDDDGTIKVITHTAATADESAVEFDVDAAGFGDVKALDIDYISRDIADGEDEGVVLVNIDDLSAPVATGGDIFALEVLATGGSASKFAVKAGAQVAPIRHDAGSFDDPTTGTDNTQSSDVAAMIDGNIATTTTIFEADDEYIIIGAAAAFQEIELILAADASVNIKPTFWYSINGTHTFTQFTPVDGTDGCRHSGVISWDASDLTAHVADDVTGTYDIKIIRTKGGNLSTDPVLGYAKTAATTEYSWDKDGDVSINNLTVAGTTTGVGGGQAMKSLPGAAWQSTSDVASWASAQAQVKQSSGGVPSPRWIEWLFDASTDEFIVIDFFVPDNYGSAPVLKVRYKCVSATSGTAAFQARPACITDADAADMDAKAFDTVNAGTATVPGTAGYVDEISITLTNADSMAANDHCILALNRDISADSVAADIEFVGAKFEYTST